MQDDQNKIAVTVEMDGQTGKADNDKFEMNGQKRQDGHHRTVIREGRTATDSQTGHDTVPTKAHITGHP